MKKLLTIIGALIFVFSSCSGDGDDTSNSVLIPVLVTKITKESNSNIETREFLYEGNKLIKEICSNETTNYFTYNGDLISYIATKDIDNVITNEIFVEYNSDNNIVRIIRLNHLASNSNIAGFRIEYTYNADGTVLRTEYYGSVSSQNNFGYKSLYYFDSLNQRIKFEDMNIDDEIILSWQFNYDQYNSPFKNVLGYHFFIFGDIYNSDNRIYGSENNITSVEDLFELGTYAYSALCVLSYNSLNYPLTNTYTNSNGIEDNYTYFYNQ